jgi:hypothetical protein
MRTWACAVHCFRIGVVADAAFLRVFLRCRHDVVPLDYRRALIQVRHAEHSAACRGSTDSRVHWLSVSGRQAV